MEQDEDLKERFEDFLNTFHSFRKDGWYVVRVVFNRLFGKTYPVTMSDVLTKNQVGALRLRMKREEVYRLFGEPTTWGVLGKSEQRWINNRRNFQSHYYQREKSKLYARFLWWQWRLRSRFSPKFRYEQFKYAALWQYESLEIGFSDFIPEAEVDYIQFELEHRQGFRLPHFIQPVGFFLKNGINTWTDFENYLKEYNIAYSKNDKYNFEDETHWIVENNSVVVNDDEDMLAVIAMARRTYLLKTENQ